MRQTQIIFDLDGTLIDSLSAHRDIYKQALAHHSIRITDTELHQLNGMSTQQGFQLLLNNRSLSQPLAPLVRTHQLLNEHIYEHIILYPDTLACLQRFEHLGLALATSSPRDFMNTILDKFSLRKYFKVLLCADDVALSKPSPEIFLAAAQQLACKPVDCLVVEDSVNGILAATRAGMKSLAVLSTTPKEFFLSTASPDAYIHSLSELTAPLLEKLFK